MNNVYYGLAGALLGVAISVATLFLVVESQNVSVHWTKSQHTIRYKHSTVLLVRR